MVITNSDETKAVAFIPKRSDNAKADSVLIKHAPEMLEMLKYLYELTEYFDEWGEEREKISELITKATTI
ncbi:MAG TPA: hypothetical protein VNR38_00975 [Ureibacillus sp.]|nr:hypothetical protein [Ureibacillus sp.]